MRKIWFVLTLVSLILIVFCSPNLSVKALTTAGERGVTLLIKLVGIYAVWLGFLEIVERSGLSERISSLLSPVVEKLFGKTDSETKQLISLNMSANMLGLGNASTPLGIKAMQNLDKQNATHSATLPMIMLVVINATSLQLIPTTIISLRQTYLSLSPTDIIFPTIIATTVSTILGIILVRICNKLNKRNINAT